MYIASVQMNFDKTLQSWFSKDRVESTFPLDNPEKQKGGCKRVKLRNFTYQMLIHIRIVFLYFFNLKKNLKTVKILLLYILKVNINWRS